MRVFICGSLLAAPGVVICLSNNASRHRKIDLYYAVRGLKSEYSIIDSHQRDANEIYRKNGVTIQLTADLPEYSQLLCVLKFNNLRAWPLKSPLAHLVIASLF